MKIYKIANKFNKAAENSIVDPVCRSMDYTVISESSSNMHKEAASSDSDIRDIKKDLKELEKKFKAIDRDVSKLSKEIDSLNIGQRRYWQQQTVFTSLQRKIERFEKVEDEWKRYKEEMDDAIKKEVEKRVRAQVKVK